MSNLIDRQAAIDATAEYLRDMAKIDNPSLPMSIDGWKPLAGKILDKVPSAQPEIIRCKECKNWDTTWQNDWAKNYHYCPLIDGTRNGDFYCADAERRTDE